MPWSVPIIPIEVLNPPIVNWAARLRALIKRVAKQALNALYRLRLYNYYSQGAVFTGFSQKNLNFMGQSPVVIGYESFWS